ncbi:U3 small nucleolar ribonucleoprotein [Cyclospora cayetanensis]|uniref:U3 small nucleolar ribonucleoprotein n=1 Tax=Cyclospora cayetanensis TaxID=88456 RepID=A0A1D3CWZ5_9EIME|nr:U3 small nucleolar ribonucleoprotein [Cyclospora cayetanensis]
MRQLKHHEQRLLRKVNFYEWKRDSTPRENVFIRRYMIQDREDYHRYNKLCGLITKLVSGLRSLAPDDSFRVKMTELLLDKLYRMGVISRREGLSAAEGLPASAFCRRRLAVVLLKNRMASHLKQAVEYIEQGHVRLGNEVVTCPALHVTRDGEDLISWAQGSAIQRHVKEFNQEADDFELLQAA